MKITVNLTKAELDLIEEALLQYQNLLLKSRDQDEVVNDELKLVERVLEEFGMEGLDEEARQQLQQQAAQQQKALPAPQGGQFPGHGQYSQPQFPGPGTYVAPNQYPFSR